MAVSPSFSARLLAWQKQAGRHDLPWQNTRDPYRIWLSEIMLQQTQVATVIPYYHRFLLAFPDVASLAAAPQSLVLEYWAGLGYYARARNLHRCAIELVSKFGGHFPDSADQLARLPGIGRSTAAAIATFAFGQRCAILDGNVKRVLCRHFGITGVPDSLPVQRILWQIAEEAMPNMEAGAYIQGQMDLGSTVCTRSRPRCDICPLADTCVARRDGLQDELPTKMKRKALPERIGSFILISDGHRLLLERRPPQGIWGGLLVPPEGQLDSVLARLGLTLVSQHQLASFRHSFTHFRLTLETVLCRVNPSTFANEGTLEWLEIADAAKAAVPTPIRKLIRQVASVAD